MRSPPEQNEGSIRRRSKPERESDGSERNLAIGLWKARRVQRVAIHSREGLLPLQLATSRDRRCRLQRLITDHQSLIAREGGSYGRGAGVGRVLGVGLTLGVMLGLGVAVAVAVGVALGVAVGVGVGVGVSAALPAT